MLRTVHFGFISLLFACFGQLGIAQPNDYFTDEYIRYEDYIYRDNIKTALLHRDGFELSAPVLQLMSGDKLRLRFDDLDGEYKDLSYTLVHCTWDWKASNLVQSEYIRGYHEAQITNYSFSFNTLEQYIQYTLSVPNQDMQLTKSGNYLLIVYEDFDKEKVILTKRFMVFEDLVKIDARVKQAAILEDRQRMHEVDFNINHEGYQISNPFGEVHVVLRQNDRWDNAITKLKPMFVKNNQLTYNYDYDNSFDGGNEYREFDVRSLRYYSERIANITYDSSYNHVFLIPDPKRTFKRYLTDRDLNGRFKVEVTEGSDNHTEADYTWVHFELAQDEPLSIGNVYVFGALSDWQCKENFKMQYSYERKSYVLSTYLKQGFYNYEFVLLEDGKKAADATCFEGSHWETENNYTIMVYHQGVGVYYDRLVALSTVSSQY